VGTGHAHGDPSYYQNVSTWADPIGHEGLLVPIETNDSANHYIALFNSSFGLLGLLGPWTGNLAWLAVNPAAGLLYLPKSYTNMTQLDAYRIQWPTNGTAFDIIYVKTLTLHDSIGGTPIWGNVQGGEFSSNGHLYVTSWNCSYAPNGGIYGFDTNGNEMMHHPVNYVLPGACGWPSTGDELEGLDVVDLDSIYPAYGGQLHLIKMDVTGVGNDDFHFMHVKVPPSVKYKL
jgi:hypothetical protein